MTYTDVACCLALEARCEYERDRKRSSGENNASECSAACHLLTRAVALVPSRPISSEVHREAREALRQSQVGRRRRGDHEFYRRDEACPRRLEFF